MPTDLDYFLNRLIEPAICFEEAQAIDDLYFKLPISIERFPLFLENILHNELILVGTYLDSKAFPLGLFLMRETELEIINLVHPDYEASLKSELDKRLERFFALPSDQLLTSLHPDWNKVLLSGFEIRPIFWKETATVEPYQKSLARISKAELALPVLPTVYPYNNPYGHPLFKNALSMEPSLRSSVLILGSGAGLEASLLAVEGSDDILGVDINPMAVKNSKWIADKIGVSDRVKFKTSDLYEKVTGRYPLILFTAPLFVHEKRPDDISRFDPQGELLKRTLRETPQHLTENGVFLLMSRPDISEFLPSFLKSRILENFKAETVSLAVHEIRA